MSYFHGGCFSLQGERDLSGFGAIVLTQLPLTLRGFLDLVETAQLTCLTSPGFLLYEP